MVQDWEITVHKRLVKRNDYSRNTTRIRQNTAGLRKHTDMKVVRDDQG